MNGLTPENTEWPTPETNAKASDIIGFFSCATVPADFARKMEHQRNEENKKLNIATEQWELTINLCQKLERELNEKASVAWNLEIALSAVSNLAAELKAERDEAMEEIDSLKKGEHLLFSQRKLGEAIRERDEAIAQRDEQVRLTLEVDRLRAQAVRECAKLRDIAERAIDLALAYYDGPCERDGAKLRAELDQLTEDREP
jgi:hypothetical protein